MAKTRKAAMKATIDACILTLMQICTKEDARDADRIAAAKLLVDMCADKTAPEQDGELKIVLKDVPPEYIR